MAEKAPKGLRAAGGALWRQVQRAVPEDAELDEREAAILVAACRQADDVAELEKMITTLGVVAVGSQGQVRVNPLVTEARQGRLALARLLGELDLTDADAEPRSARSRRARQAANARWDHMDQVADLRRRRAGA